MAGAMFVVNLDLSSNQFSGEIPADIANCSFLNNIKLDNNKLEGTIPPEIGLLGRIKTFNVANNMLTVQVKKMLLLIKKSTNAMKIDGNEWPDKGIEVNNDPKILKLEKIVTRMSFMELSKATSNFSQENESGKECWESVQSTGPKWMDSCYKEAPMFRGFGGKSLFRDHNSGGRRLLVYKYMPNGNLHEWLHSTDDKARLLDFPLRVKIAVGIAKALAWLHIGQISMLCIVT
ncbi:hypothetical protein HAX54_023667 [Datura stramonium]|uniref:Uncharacterized protein n=1 Tax=Datura stramonium TaxID=4076 RepID=A0ABS8UXT0_DATST|nr:hypothetical protein [Datura stramonium]